MNHIEGRPPTLTVPRPILIIGAFWAWLGILIQFGVAYDAVSIQRGGAVSAVWVMIGYFTILTNLIVATYYSTLLLAPGSRIGAWFGRPATASAIAMYVALVMVVVHLILRPIMNLSGIALFADNILHYVTPGLFLLVWAVWITKRTLRWWYVLVWTAYPLAYLVYALVRGATTGFYPYPFINVSRLGYAQVFENAALMTLAFVVAGLIFVALDRWWPLGGSAHQR